MDAYIGVLIDEDLLELIDIVDRQRGRKVKRTRENRITKCKDAEFIRRFRLSTNGVRYVLQNIAQRISHPTQRNNAGSAVIMLFVTLMFVAAWSFLQILGAFVDIDKSAAYRIVTKVSFEQLPLHIQDL